MAADPSIQELYDKRNSTRSDILSLLTDTIWPSESNKAVDALTQTINDLPNFLTDASATSLKNTYMEFIRVLEGAYTRLKDASESYGKGKRGPVGALKAKLSSGHRRRCTDTLWGCRAEIENGLADLRNDLDKFPISGTVQDSGTPSEAQPQSTTPLVEVDHPNDSLRAPQTSRTEAVGQTVASEHPTSQPATPQDSSLGTAEEGEKRASIRGRVLNVAQKTFKVVETASGAIPVVGDFVGVAAKVGLAFVDMIETMDSNDDVSKELTSHTGELSSQLEHFKKKVNVETGDQIAARIEKLRQELERVQVKVNKWNSSGVFKKLLLSGDHAEEFRASQDTVQTTLDRMQLLVSLKTNDIVVELNDTVLRAERTRLLDRLGDGSYGARGGSIEEVTCLRGTRVELLNRIDVWIKDSSTSAQRVLWVRGMAGRGKSAIASTVAHNWSSKGSCAIFHFRRGQHAQDDRFICALARQLGKSLVPEVKKAILDCVKENEDIAKERLEQQFKTLFVGSLRNVQVDAHPIVIVVDALDECQNVNDAVRFVRLLDQLSSLLPANVKFLLTCRPETPLIKALEPRTWHAEDLDSASHVSEDITLFLQHACNEIRKAWYLPETWPPPPQLQGLAKMSQGLFQWARTAVAFIGDGSPAHRLRELLQNPEEWRGLDDLYLQILSRAFDKAGRNSGREQVLSWALGAVVVAPHPITLEIIAFLHGDHKIFKGQDDIPRFLRDDILADLNSLLHIPTSQSEPMRLMHTSIRDLLAAQARCENQRYFVDPIQDHLRLATVSLEIMHRDLKQNICNLPGVPSKNSDILDTVNLRVVSGLRYCCRSWSNHLVSGVSSSPATADAANTVLDKFKVFSDEKILSWLEVMSLIGAMGEAHAVAKEVHRWLSEWPRDVFDDEAHAVAKEVHRWLSEWPRDVFDDSLITLWYDTRRFITGFFEKMSTNALDIYASCLPRCPVETKLWPKYRGQARAWTLYERERNWSANIWTASAADNVNVVAFSPDGGTVASGSGQSWLSGEYVVQLWDVQTGAPLGEPLTGHEESVTCVVFSPDGKILASGSNDQTLRLWDVQTGAPLGDPLTGHEWSVTCVVFSPDGKVLASGSNDNTLRLWDVQTRTPLGEPLTGHTKEITSIVFSPDGNVLASGSLDRTIRWWGGQTGAPLGDPPTGHKSLIKCVEFLADGKVLASGSRDQTIRWRRARTRVPFGHPLTSHKQEIKCLVFSPDGKVLASGSEDQTVRLWDTQTGAPLGDPLTGHNGQITCVVFSPDGKVLASGSFDHTVRLWDAQTRAPLGDPLTGHSYLMVSAVFSPDGKLLASGSPDKTVRLWDVQTRAPLGDPPTGHMEPILSASLSPDGKVLASRSLDGRVRLWDAQTGAPSGGSRAHHNEPIWSVVFSPDGKVLAFGTGDKTVLLLDTQTGAPLGDPLTGHTDSINSVVFSPDSKVLASGSIDKTVRFWDTQTRAPLGDPLTGHTSSISSIAFSPDGKVLASGSFDHTVRLWDARTRAPLGDPLTGHSDSIAFVVFSPDSKVLASRSSDKTVRLWDTQTRAPLGDPLTGHDRAITCVVFSLDGKALAFGSSEGAIQFWDVQTRAPLGDPLTGHTSRIVSILFSPCGKIMYSVSDDGMVRFWEFNTFKSLTAPQLFDILTCSHQTDEHVIPST